MTTHEGFGNMPSFTDSLSNAPTTVLAGDMAPGAFPMGEDIGPGNTSSDENKSLSPSTGKVDAVDTSAHADVTSDTGLDGTDAGATGSSDSSSTSTASSDSTDLPLSPSGDSSAPIGFDVSTVTVTPEPSTLFLAGIVLVGLGTAGRKKRSSR